MSTQNSTLKSPWPSPEGLPPYPRYSLDDWLEEMSSTQPVHHSKLYLEGGDVIFQVENLLFRLHSYFFVRESAYFRELLLEPHGMYGELKVRPNSDRQPFHLDVTVPEFAALCWVFYNPKYSVYEASADKWADILHLGQGWGFAEVTALAVRELEKLDVPPVQKIALYQRHGIDGSLLQAAFEALARRPEPLTPAEGMALGIETFARIAHAREMVRAPETPSPTLLNITTDGIRSIFEKVGLSPSLKLRTEGQSATGPLTAPALGQQSRRPFDTVPPTPLESIPETPTTNSSEAPPSYDKTNLTKASYQGTTGMRRTNSLGFGFGHTPTAPWTGRVGGEQVPVSDGQHADHLVRQTDGREPVATVASRSASPAPRQQLGALIRNLNDNSASRRRWYMSAMSSVYLGALWLWITW